MVHSSFVPTQPQPLIWHCCLQSSLAFLGQYWVYFGRYRPEAQIGCNKDQQTLRRGDCSFTVMFKFIQNWIDILIIQNCSAGHDSTGNPPAAKQKICSSSSLLESVGSKDKLRSEWNTCRRSCLCSRLLSALCCPG